VKPNAGEKIFNLVNTLVLGLLGLSCVYPFIYVLSMSLSSAAEASRQGLHLFPWQVSWTSYKIVLSDPGILLGFWNSIVRTVVGTILTLLATCVAAYPLSRKEMPHRSLLQFLILFTMLFGGGLVPNYLLIHRLGLINNRFSLILPGLITGFNVIVLRRFFQAIPDSLCESARIDGAGEWRILFSIFIPLSKPVLATVALWTAVAHWNAWLDALLYITDGRKQVLQVALQSIVVQNSFKAMDMGVTDAAVVDFSSETVKAATIMITVLPMLLLYPFVQKYFVRGILLGSVKE
jgi:putative aldouronate transport system permease protein